MHACRRAPDDEASERALTVKPSGIYLKHLRTTTLESEINSADSIFGEYDVVRDYIREHALDTVGDLYEEELSIYIGSTGKAVHTEISIRLSDDDARNGTGGQH